MIVEHAAIGRICPPVLVALALAACAVTPEPKPVGGAHSASAVEGVGGDSETVADGRNTPFMSMGYFAASTRAAWALDEDDYAAAQRAMDELDLETVYPFERSEAELIQFQIANESENYDEARAHLQAALDLGGMEDQRVADIHHQIAQTFLAEGKWAECVSAVEDWLGAHTPSAPAYYLLASAYYRMEDFDRSLLNAERAVEFSEQPQENRLRLLAALYMQHERWRDAAPVLEQLVVIAPDNERYWAQLATVYAEAGMTAERDALAVRAPNTFLPLPSH